jgi:hypothetical protein
MQYYNRYQKFLIDGRQTVVPFVSIGTRTTDQSYVYIKNRTRLDKISFEKYGSPYFGWLILAANPIYGGLETEIPDGSVIILPFPLLTALKDYKSAIDTHIFYYGR